MAKTIVVDLGKQKKKSVKRLREGEGALMEEVRNCLEELKSAGKLSGSQPVVFIVEQKSQQQAGRNVTGLNLSRIMPSMSSIKF